MYTVAVSFDTYLGGVGLLKYYGPDHGDANDCKGLLFCCCLFCYCYFVSQLHINLDINYSRYEVGGSCW